MNKMEDLLTRLPPKFLLDHYWVVFDEIICYFTFGVSNFTVVEFEKKLLEKVDIFEKVNPITFRTYLRSISVINEVIDVLINLGLIIKDKENLKVTNEFLQFYNMLKRLRKKRSLKVYTSWAILCLNQKGFASFTTRDLLSLLSYKDEDYKAEIPNLVKYKEKRWYKILRESSNEWILQEEPTIISKRILLLADTSIYDRLSNAILKLSKTQFSTDDIIRKLRELEEEKIEKILSLLGLKSINGIWKVNSRFLRRIKKSLELRSKQWPILGIIVEKIGNPYFNLQSKKKYIDMPTNVISEFLDELNNIVEKYKSNPNPENIYYESKTLASNYNQELERNSLDWIRFVIRKQPRRAREPFGIWIKINWNKFYSFLDNFAVNQDISLDKKYEYIIACKEPALVFTLRDINNINNIKNEVKEICKKEIEEISQKLEWLINKISKMQNSLVKWRLIKYSYLLSLTLAYLPDLISKLRIIIRLVEEGEIQSCYREMRKVLEDICWVIFDDILLYRTSLNEDFNIAYRYMSPNWYKNAPRKKSGELESYLKKFIGMIKRDRQNLGFSYTEDEIMEKLYKHISYPLFLLLTGQKLQSNENNDRIPQYEVSDLKNRICKTIKCILEDLGLQNICLTVLIDRFISDVLKLDNNYKIIPSYLPINFIIYFVGKVSSIDSLRTYYEKYSYFVHFYPNMIQISSFLSVLEFKIFYNEIDHFTKDISRLLEFYLEELRNNLHNLKINNVV